jgi:hypothetical protein
MLDLRSPDPRRAAADRRAAIVGGYTALVFITFIAVLGGAGGGVVWFAGTLALAGFPWLLVFEGRPDLLGDALAGRGFAARGQRPGVWATAPAAGALLALLGVAVLGVGTFLGVVLCLAGAAAYTGAIVAAERAYERSIYLELTVLEQRFEAITDARPPRARRPETADLPHS